MMNIKDVKTGRRYRYQHTVGTAVRVSGKWVTLDSNMGRVDIKARDLSPA